MEEVRWAQRLLEQEFTKAPTLFFTEHDVASRLYHLVQEELAYVTVEAADGSLHYLVHHEYPTPFRCNMGGRSFSVMDEETRTPKGGKYKRGHYDLVVFNPDFVKRSGLEVIRGQDYSLLKRELPAIMSSLEQPPILVGVELAYNRAPFASEAHVERWCELVLQDYLKLEASRMWMRCPFMKEVFLVAFDGCNVPRFEELIQKQLGQYVNIKYCHAQGSRTPPEC